MPRAVENVKLHCSSKRGKTVLCSCTDAEKPKQTTVEPWIRDSEVQLCKVKCSGKLHRTTWEDTVNSGWQARSNKVEVLFRFLVRLTICFCRDCLFALLSLCLFVYFLRFIAIIVFVSLNIKIALYLQRKWSTVHLIIVLLIQHKCSVPRVMHFITSSTKLCQLTCFTRK